MLTQWLKGCGRRDVRSASAPSGPVRAHGALAIAAVTMLLGASAVHAGDREQARRIHDRLAGVPPTDAVLDLMTADVAAENPVAAANRAMENRSFYDVTLKNFAMPWTNRDQTVFAPLNDYVATVIGMVRDDVPFNQVLYEDILYVGSGSACRHTHRRTTIITRRSSEGSTSSRC